MFEKFGKEELQKILWAALTLVIMIAGIYLFKSILVSSFYTTETIGFVISAFVSLFIGVFIISMFFSGGTRTMSILALCTVVALLLTWSTVKATSEPSGEAIQDSATGYLVGLVNWFRPSTPRTDEVALSADMQCDQALAEYRLNAEKIFLDQFNNDANLEKYLAARKILAEKMAISSACKSSSSKDLDGVIKKVTKTFTGATQSLKVTVPANVKWYNPGLNFDGQRIRIRRESGQWTNGGSSPIYTDANGSGSWNGTIVPSAPFRSLVARNNGNSFLVGNEWTGVINGGLELSINDTESFFDNKGVQNLVIEIE